MIQSADVVVILNMFQMVEISKKNYIDKKYLTKILNNQLSQKIN